MPYPDELACGDENNQALRCACSDEIIAQLLAVELDLLGVRADVGFPVNNQVNQSDRLICDRVGDTAYVDGAVLISLGCKRRRENPSVKRPGGPVAPE